nr:hypothetical protein [Tanacetum cinerariifolium]
MESLSPQVISAAKLPILNPNEFDLCKMRIEQYFLMTNYSLWEVILNGDSPIPTRVIDGVVQPVAPTTAEQRLARKNELKAHLEDQSLDDLFNSLKIYKAEVKSSSTTSTTTQNIAFVSSQSTDSTNELLDNDDLKQIDADDLEELDLKWQMTMLTMRARRFLQRTRRNLRAIGTTSIGFDIVMVLEAIIGAFRQKKNQPTMPSWHSLPQVLLVLIIRDNALVELRKKFKKAEQERDELKLKLDKFQTSFKNVTQLIASQTNDKTGLGYDNQVFNSFMFDCDEMFSSKSDVSMPASLVYDRYKSGERYHAVPPPYTGT